MNIHYSKIWRHGMVLFAVTIILAGLDRHNVLANPVSVSREYTYRASEADSKLTSRTIALEQVKRLLLEELGTYLSSLTEVRAAILTKDEIVTYTAGWVSTVVIKESWNGEEYYLKAKITADADDVAKAIALMHDDREKSTELQRLRSQANQSLKEIERLRRELAEAKSAATQGNTATVAAVQKDYDTAVARLTATEKTVTEYDGNWAVSLHCDNVQIKGHTLKGYTTNFPAKVKDGKLMGQYGTWGQPDSLIIIGDIQQDGTVRISAQGQTTTRQEYVPLKFTNKPYSYHMTGLLTPTDGKATRVEFRPCEATFFKQ